MLVLARKAGESIMIGGGITVTVLRQHGATVRLGIEAPRATPVLRSELLEGNESDQRSAISSQQEALVG